MGAAAYNRGSRVVAGEADQAMPAADARADRQAYKDEAARLRNRIAVLECDLQRARRCLAATRYSHEERMAEARAAQRLADSTISALCRIAFPNDRKGSGE